MRTVILIGLFSLLLFGCGGGGCDNCSSGIYFDEATYYHILSTGQSLSLGYFARPPLSIEQPYKNLTLEDRQGIALIPLTEPMTNPLDDICESPSSGLANNLGYQSNKRCKFGKFIVTNHGKGSSPYWYINKGTENWEMGRRQVINSQAAVHKIGLDYKVLAVTAVHGESDALSGSGPKYYRYLNEWQADYDEMVKSITGQKNDIPLFICQLSTFAMITPLFPNTPRAVEIAFAQLNASVDNQNIYLVTPKYHIPYSGEKYPHNLHLSNIGSRWLGEKYGEVMWRVFGLREDWMPLQPDPKHPVIRDSNVIYVKLHVPDPPLVIDTELVPEQKNYGFSYVDSDGQTQITNVSIVDEDTIRIELSQVPTGRDQRIRYGVDVDPKDPLSHSKGNIRDSDAYEYYYGDLPAYNWLVHFEAEVVG